MTYSKNFLGQMLWTLKGSFPSRRARQAAPTVDSLEGRVVLSHMGAFNHQAHSLASLQTTLTGRASNETNETNETNESTSNTSIARRTLRNDVQAIELNSGTTVGQLAAIGTTFRTLGNDGLRPSSPSALASFKNSLVTSHASGTTLTGNATLLSQFNALYTSSPTAQQTTDLTAAYNALAAAATSTNITSANITTINTDWAAVLTAQGSTSTSTFPYFSLVTGRSEGFGERFGGGYDD